MTTIVAAKTCTRCGRLKPLDEFNTRKASADGYTARCASCNAQISAASRAKKKAEAESKTCVSCGTVAPREDFPRDWDEPDRRSPICHPCTAAEAAEAEAWAAAGGGFLPAHYESAPPPIRTGEAATSDWRHDAECRGEDPELFHPVGSTGDALLQIEEAKAVCRRCPVMGSCLAYALDEGLDSGVWGGMSEDERRALKRRATRNRARATA